jgi:hypothetical protein
VLFLDMAKQSGAHIITGTIDNLCFYRMEGKYYVRMKHSLNGERVKKDPAFSNTMQYASMLASASVIASALYKRLTAQQKVKGLFRSITGQAMQLLKAGMSTVQAAKQLEHVYLKPVRPRKRTITPSFKSNFYARPVTRYVFAARLPDNRNTAAVLCCYAPP